jgi:hypothetical protein
MLGLEQSHAPHLDVPVSLQIVVLFVDMRKFTRMHNIWLDFSLVFLYLKKGYLSRPNKRTPIIHSTSTFQMLLLIFVHLPRPNMLCPEKQLNATLISMVRSRVQCGMILTSNYLFFIGVRCDAQGIPLDADAPPPPWEPRDPDDFYPFESRLSFELADVFYRRAQMSASDINDILQIWAARHGDAPFADTPNLHETIDALPLGDISWSSFSVKFNGDIGDGTNVAPWKLKEYDVWFCDPRAVLHQQLANRSFAGEMDFAAKKVTDRSGKRRYKDFMSGEWIWRQSVRLHLFPTSSSSNVFIIQDILALDYVYHGVTICSIILGSDKTTVSVATGQNEYYPLYLSNGLIHNNVRRAHRNAMSLVAFLAIPKSRLIPSSF